MEQGDRGTHNAARGQGDIRIHHFHTLLYGDFLDASLALVNTGVYGEAVTDRLSKSDWVAHGLRTLARYGPGALKVGALATALGVSRGSFYWHFADLADFRTEVLDLWRVEATDAVIGALEQAMPPGPERLRELMRRAFVEQRPLDRALRSWATSDAQVEAVVEVVDARRIAYIAGMLTDAGVPGDHAGPRAAFIYWAYLGQAMVTGAGLAALPAAAIDDIAALFVSPAALAAHAAAPARPHH